MADKKKKSFRVYFIEHADGRLSGILIRRWDLGCFDIEPPAAYGDSEQSVLEQLEVLLVERGADLSDPLERYLWEERFEVRRIKVDVHPQTLVNKRPVIGKRSIPLRLGYAWFAIADGDYYKVMLPRFGWWMIVEDLDTAPEVLRNAVSGVLLGEEPRWLYDFRHEGQEYVREWSPDLLRRSELLSEQTPEQEQAKQFPQLSQVAEELVERAARRKLPRTVGREPLRDEHLKQLDLDQTRPSLLLVGGPGVGKSTWVRQLARHLATERRDRRRRGEHLPRIWRTSGQRIIAGMIYLGQWQQRCFDIIDELSAEGDYLCVDRLTSILQPQPDGSSIAELLLPAMAANEIRLIAECSEPELQRCRQRFPQLVDQFVQIRIAEAVESQMPQLLRTYIGQRTPQLQVDDRGLRQAVTFLAAFSRHQKFPGKAFHFVDWLGSTHRESTNEQTKAIPERVKPATSAPGEIKRLYAGDIASAYARYSGLPLELIADDQPAGAAVIAGRLEAGVVGQPTACSTCARVLTRFKAGTNDPERPMGTLLFVGPTGVGKTEMAKQLARYLYSDEKRMIRLDMSEYSVVGSAARLMRVGEGVRSLAEQVRQQPLSLILLDEIEKAHPEVFDLLLGVLGEGRLTDDLGRLVDFRTTLIVMTSNLGVSDRAPVGFGDRVRDDYLTHVRKHFRPEFFNRLDHVIAFSALRPVDIEQIVELQLQQAAGRTGLQRRALRLVVDADARTLLARRGFHPTRGARPLKRLIEQEVITPLAVLMAREPQLTETTIWVLAEGSATYERLSQQQQQQAIILI